MKKKLLLIGTVVLAALLVGGVVGYKLFKAGRLGSGFYNQQTPTLGNNVVSNSFTLNSTALNVTTTLYVDPVGSDTNACTSASTTACQTIQAALNKTCGVAGGKFDIQVAAGTYNEALVACSRVGGISRDEATHGGNLTRIYGSSTVPSSVVLGGDNTVVTNMGAMLTANYSSPMLLEGVTVSSTWTTATNPAAVVISGSDVDFKDVDFKVSGGGISAANYSLVTIRAVDHTTTTVQKVGDTSSIFALTQSRLIQSGSMNVSTTVNSLFLTGSTGSLITLGAAGQNLFVTTNNNVAKRAITLSSASALTISYAKTNFYNFNTPAEVSANLKSSVLQSVSGGTFTMGSTSLVFDNCRIPLALYEGSRYLENTAITWSLNNGTSSSIFVDPSSAVEAATGNTHGGVVFAPFAGRVSDTIYGWQYATNTFYATSTFSSPASSTFAGPVSITSNQGLAFAFASSTSASTTFAIDSGGRIATGGPSPAISSCGAGTPTVVGDDSGGTITVANTATLCTLTFVKAYNQTPYCVVTANTSAVATGISAISATAVTFGFTSSNPVLYYFCGQHLR